MLLLVATVTAGGCARAASKVDSPGAPPAIGELWEQPADLEFAQGSRNDLDGFEQQGFIRRVRDDGRIDFDYQGVNHDLLGNSRGADVKWTCALMARITDSQWDDAFRAGGFAPGERARYIRKIKEEVQQGLNLTDPPAG